MTAFLQASAHLQRLNAHRRAFQEMEESLPPPTFGGRATSINIPGVEACFDLILPVGPLLHQGKAFVIVHPSMWCAGPQTAQKFAAVSHKHGRNAHADPDQNLR